ncbi:choice-of-anchor J domain-containing protein [Flavobacterium sp.]|jgi:hypothetical protein|uniref:choice-of-anchor J domain-containing protein n=1 Tax=Flavobacterium sp. TaxID=239 RepID=UPI0037BF9FFC
MKKLLPSLMLLMLISNLNAQNIYNYGFDGTTSTMMGAGWTVINQSAPTYATANKWNIPTSVPVNYFSDGGQAGGTFSFATVNFQSTGTSSSAGSGTISNWLISPSVNVQNGNVVSFYTITGRTAPIKADRLQLRMSTNGDFSTDPSLGANDVGDYIDLLIDVNPDQSVVGYPSVWTKYSYTITGLSGITECKFAFRYFVTSGGPSGANSDQIGIDTFSVDTVLSVDDFFQSNFIVGPNPATDVVNISAKNSNTINTVEITDINGRIVKNETVNATTSQINVADLNSGVYFLKASSENGVGTTKMVKK